MGNFYTSNKNKNNVLFLRNCNSSMFRTTDWKTHELTKFTFSSYEHRINDKTVKIMLTFPPRNQRRKWTEKMTNIPCLSLDSIDFSASTDALFPTNRRLAKSFL